MGLPYTFSYAPTISILRIAINEIVFAVIWGVIFGIFYSILYESIPGKGVSRGLAYGFLILIISRIRHVSYGMVYGFIPFAISNIFIGFFTSIVYGLVLGLLYKPPK